MSEEIWKSVVGYEGLYQDSNIGRVRSLDRIDSLGRIRKGRVLKQIAANHGYLCVVLCCNGKPKTHLVHCLVAASFIGPRPEGYDICHGPAGKLDNSGGNLSYGSRRKNSADDRNRDNVYSSRFPGVSWHKKNKKWQANAYFDGKCNHLGLFEDENEAAAAYQKAREEIEYS